MNIFKKQVLVESLKQFKNKGDSRTSKQIENTRGEGFDDISTVVSGYGKESLRSFNSFYNDFINQTFENEMAKIHNYRQMAEMPEIASVIEDIVIESTQEDILGDVLTIEFKDKELLKNTNVMNNLQEEFVTLFNHKLNIVDQLWDFFRSYYIDGRIYIEKVINKNKSSIGIQSLKKLPAESMDYSINPKTGKIDMFFQYLKPNIKTPKSLEDAENDPDIIVFFPEQILYIDYGLYGNSKKDIFGYMEKVKQPFNQLKLLETSLVIYRIVKAPERLVFRIDTGSMPKNKAMAFVESIKQKLNTNVSYDPNTGQLKNQSDIMSMMDSYYLPQCLRLNTKISCLDGNDKTLEQIIEEFNQGIKNEVLSVDQSTGKIIKGIVEWAGITRKNAEMVRVHLDSGDSVDVTPDHKFVMRDGSDIEAQYLKNNDSLMPYYTRNKKVCSTSNEYKQVYDMNDGEWKFVHRVIKPVKHGNVVHHNDFNRFNNMSDNLKEMNKQYHFIYHSEMAGDRLTNLWKDDEFRKHVTELSRIRSNKRWSSQEERDKQSIKMKLLWKNKRDELCDSMKCINKTDEHKQSLSVSIKNKWKDVEYRTKSSKSSKNRWLNKDFRDNMINKQHCIVNDKCKSLFVKLYNENDKPSMSSFIGILSSNDDFMSEWININKDKKNVCKTHLGKTSFYHIIKGIGYSDYTDFKNNIIINHKVDYVETLSFREDTGCLTIKDSGNNHNFPLSIGIFVKNSADGRGSDVSSIGGNPSGFAELDDIWYFARKLYTALKYPMSRVMNMQEGRQGDSLFMQGSTGEISRDEIKWSKFLERHQNKFAKEFSKLFLLHLDFMGLKKEYELSIDDINIMITPPNNYKEQMNQTLLETQMNNYSNFSNNPEFSKTFLMKEYLKWDDEMVKSNADGFTDDKKFLPGDDF